MRLLHATEFTLKECFDRNIPDYGILSHRWGSDEEEVSYQDFLAGRKRDSKGYAKIQNACQLAASGEHEYTDLSSGYRRQNWIWIDTCCIDKSSSAELSEAINSMYQWYRYAVICYVYLDDVDSKSSGFSNMKQFRGSQWFTRGWTLQELLAPRRILFLDKNWLPIGDRETLQEEISSSTRISKYDLLNFIPAEVPAAMKMQWASQRDTSRKEDIAYCLLGIFEINMPLLYGEGENAFRRLQMEIIRSSNDESIFAWATGERLESALARSPSNFVALDISKEYKFQRLNRNEKVQRHPYTITNQGLEIRVPAAVARKRSIIIPLDCVYPGEKDEVYAMAVEQRGPNYVRVAKYGSGTRNPDSRWNGYCGPVSRIYLWTRERLKISGSDVIYLKL